MCIWKYNVWKCRSGSNCVFVSEMLLKQSWSEAYWLKSFQMIIKRFCIYQMLLKLDFKNCYKVEPEMLCVIWHAMNRRLKWPIKLCASFWNVQFTVSLKLLSTCTRKPRLANVCRPEYQGHLVKMDTSSYQHMYVWTAVLGRRFNATNLS